jgi:peptidoglycan-associated lipoprotein
MQMQMPNLKSRTCLLLVCAATALAPACTAKRGSAIGAVPTSGAASGAHAGTPIGSATPEPEKPIDAGPDVQPLAEDGAAGREMAGADGGVLSDIYFDLDKSSLTDEAAATLQKHARWLQQNPVSKLTVEGHCDERGTVEYNMALGDLRAQAVREYLVSLGVVGDRLATVSYGKEQPVERASTEAAYSKNRRAHFVVQR